MNKLSLVLLSVLAFVGCKSETYTGTFTTYETPFDIVSNRGLVTVPAQSVLPSKLKLTQKENGTVLTMTIGDQKGSFKFEPKSWGSENAISLGAAELGQWWNLTLTRELGIVTESYEDVRERCDRNDELNSGISAGFNFRYKTVTYLVTTQPVRVEAVARHAQGFLAGSFLGETRRVDYKFVRSTDCRVGGIR